MQIPITQSTKSTNASVHLIFGESLVITGVLGVSSSFLSLCAFHYVSKLLMTCTQCIFTAAASHPTALKYQQDSMPQPIISVTWPQMQNLL